MWQDWLNGLVGFWLIISALGGFNSQLNLVITGVVIIVLSAWELVQYQGQAHDAKLMH
jgi:hypothetical protein